MPLSDRFDAFDEAHPSGKLRIAGVEWEYIAGGSDPLSVVLLGGGGTTCDSMFTVHEALEERAKVVAISVPTGVTTAEAATAGIVAIMDSLGMRRSVLVGHSLGGMLAQAFAVRYPDRVNGPVLANTGHYLGLRAKLVPLYIRLAVAAPAGLNARLVSAQITRLLGDVEDAAFWKDFCRSELDEVRLQSHLRLMLDLVQGFQQQPISSDLEWTRRLPVQIIASEDDRGFTRREIDYLASLYPRAETLLFSKGGHLTFLTHREESVGPIFRLLR